MEDNKNGALPILPDQSTPTDANTHITFNQVIAQEDANSQGLSISPKKKTRKQAGSAYPEMLHVQWDKLFLLTHPHYDGGLDLFENKYAYLKIIDSEAKTEIKDGILYVDGKAVDRVKYMDHVSDKAIKDIDKPLVQALFSLVWMKLEPLLDDICLPDGIYGEIFQKKLSDMDYVPLSERYHMLYTFEREKYIERFGNMSVDNLRNNDTRDLYELYYKDLLDFTVVVHMRDLMRYLGYGSSPSNEQMEAVRGRMQALSRVIGVLRYDAEETYMSAEHLLLDYGFDPDNNVVFIHSPYMNKLVELISRDRIQRFFTTRNGVKKPVLENGNITYYPAFTRLVHPDIASAKNKRAVEVVFAFARLIVATGKQTKSAKKEKTPNISFVELMNRCYDLRVPIIYGKAQNLNTCRRRNETLKRTFENVYEYLKLYTSIPDEYIYDEYMPTDDDDHVFKFHLKKN